MLIELFDFSILMQKGRLFHYPFELFL